MKLWIGGKVAGTTVGLVVGGPVGALVGLAVGHALDHFTRPDDPDDLLRAQRPIPPPGVSEPPQGARASAPSAGARRTEIDEAAHLRFTTHLVALFAAVARADGTIRREEVQTIRRFFAEELRLGEAELDLVRRLLKRALQTPVDVEAAARRYKEVSSGADRMLFVQALYEMVCDRGDPTPAEQKTINEIVVALDLSEADHHAIRALFFSTPGLEEDYARLGIEPGVGDDELKRAFRKLAAKHHPDRVTHLGPDAVAMAGKRFAEIKAAYDRIRAARGL